MDRKVQWQKNMRLRMGDDLLLQNSEGLILCESWSFKILLVLFRDIYEEEKECTKG